VASAASERWQATGQSEGAQPPAPLPGEGSGQPPEDPRYLLVYEEAVRAIEQQEATLDNLRARAGYLLTATAIATSFFGTTAFKAHHVHFAGWVAVGCFVGAMAFLLVALMPLGDWRFRFGAKALIRDYVEAEEPATIDKMRRDLALHLQNNVTANEDRLKKLWWAISVAIGLLLFEIVAWIVAVR
jgi:hypothetical protein